jgi:gluconolactonase
MSEVFKDIRLDSLLLLHHTDSLLTIHHSPNMHPSLTIYNPTVTQFIQTDFEVEIWSEDCLFTEGPVWNPEGFYLFSDITANCIYRISGKGNKTVFLSNSGTPNPEDPDLKPGQAGSNALAYDRDGALLICQHGSHGIARYKNGTLEPFIETFRDHPFNSPNDFILHSDGRIYFSDPPYGLKDSQLHPDKFQPLAGVYCWKDGELQMICGAYQFPNGVCLSPDESVLYICSNKPFENFISAYDTKTHGFVKILAEENSDGIECDPQGHVYLCNKDGIIILDASGARMALIRLPSIPANICWGGKESKDLFITAREKIICIPGLLK